MDIDCKPKKITQREIARRIGVSQGIVSVVLRQAPMSSRISDDTKRRILQLAREHDYPVAAGSFRPARMGNVIGILVKKEINQFFQDLVTLLNDLLEEHGYRCIVSRLDLETPDPDLEEFLQQIIAYNYAGMICLGHFSPKVPEMVPRMLEHYPNVVFFNTPRGIKSAPCVHIDFGSGVREAVEHLCATGRRRIALLLNDMISDSTKARFAGYCAGLMAGGLPMQPELCWVAEDHNLRGWEGEPLHDIVARIMETLMRDNPPDALIAPNDQWAVALIHALKDRGIRVPQEVAVVGYGNYEAYCNSCEPALSSVSHGNRGIACALIEVLDNLITGRSEVKAAAQVEVKSFLVHRKSC